MFGLGATFQWERFVTPTVIHVLYWLHAASLSPDPPSAGVAPAASAAARDTAVIVDRLAADDAVLEIAMADTGGVRPPGAARHGPGARLLRRGGEERPRIEQPIAGADQTVEA